MAAVNKVGTGAYSPATVILTCNVPTRMNTPYEDPLTNATQVVVDWAPITLPADTGRDPVIYYKLEWDSGLGTNVWTELTSPNTSVVTWKQNTTNNAANNIIYGTTYKYRVTPLNRAGFGAVSAVVSIIPSSPPVIMTAPTVTLNSTGTSVKVAWVIPTLWAQPSLPIRFNLRL